MFKTLGLTFLLLILFFDSFGQDYRWKIGVTGGPTLRNLHVTNRTLWADGIDNADEEEFSLLSWDVGIAFENTINEKWVISSGLFYSKKGWESIPILAYDVWANELIAKTSILYHFEFIELPLLLQYNFYRRSTCKLFIRIGPSAGWLLSDYRTLNVQWGTPTENQKEELYESFDARNYHYRNFNIGIWLGLGINKTLSERIELSAEPQFKAFITDVNNLDEYEFFKTNPDRRKLYSFGLNLGIHYRFIKKKPKI